MKVKSSNETYCIFCESTEELREFKTVYVCETCIESAKEFEAPELLVE